MENRKPKRFRLRSRKFFLTYPQLNSSVEELESKVLKALKLKIKNIEHYIISKEKHEDGGTHIHCFLELRSKLDVLGEKYLDINIEGVEYHGNYQVARKKEALMDYIIKDNCFITNMNLIVKDGKRLQPEEHLFEICKEQGLKKARETLDEYYPCIAVKRGEIILKNLRKFSEFETSKKFFEIQKENIFLLEDFDKLSNEKINDIHRWMKEGLHKGFKLTLILYGPGGTGKTMLAKSIFKDMKIDPLIINDINDFRNYDSDKHKGILIDDLDTESLARLQILNLIDSEQGKTIRVLYGQVNPNPYIPRIMTTNQLSDFTEKGRDELTRRIKTIYIPESISSKFNINIQQNIYNTNNNHIQIDKNDKFFGETLGISKEDFKEIMIKMKEWSKKNDTI